MSDDSQEQLLDVKSEPSSSESWRNLPKSVFKGYASSEADLQSGQSDYTESVHSESCPGETPEKGDALRARPAASSTPKAEPEKDGPPPFATDDDSFGTDVSEYVVIDMPLRKPSFYAQRLERLEDDDTEARSNLFGSYSRIHFFTG